MHSLKLQAQRTVILTGPLTENSSKGSTRLSTFLASRRKQRRLQKRRASLKNQTMGKVPSKKIILLSHIQRTEPYRTSNRINCSICQQNRQSCIAVTKKLYWHQWSRTILRSVITRSSMISSCLTMVYKTENTQIRVATAPSVYFPEASK